MNSLITLNETKTMALRSVFYIEDEPDIRTVVSLILSSRSIKVWQFESGADAIEKATECVPELILMDLTMDEMDGIETLERLREIPGYQKIPCVFVTARIDQPSHDAIDRFENVSVIRKPFDPTTLVSELEEIVS